MTLFLIKKLKEDICELIIENPPSKFSVRLRDTDLQRLKAEIRNYENEEYNEMEMNDTFCEITEHHCLLKHFNSERRSCEECKFIWLCACGMGEMNDY